MPESAPEVIRVGVLGLGRSGWNIHADACADHPAFTVVAAADPVAERRAEAEARFGCATYIEPSDVIADESVDLVVVATPSHTHVGLSVDALKSGKHVLVEKPMAQSPEGVDEMITAATDAGKVLTCYQPRRVDPDFLAVRAAVTSGQLGELVFVRRAIHRFMRRTDWQMLRKFDGGELSNTVPHLLDQALQFAAPDAEFELLADLRHTVGAGDAEDHARLTLQPRDGGPLLEVEASSVVALPQPGWLVVGTNGAISGSSADDLTIRWSDPASWGPLTVDEGPAVGRKYGTSETLEWSEEKLDTSAFGRPAALAFYDHLAATLHDGADPLVTPESIRRQIEILNRARQQTGYL